MLSFRSPCVIRFVTVMVLMISDLDVIFSFLFMINVFNFHPFLGRFFLIVIIVGLLTYMAAILYFGPKNKFRTVKVVRQMMVNCRDQFEIPGQRGVYLDANSLVIRGQRTPAPKYKDLELTQEGCDAFKAGLCSYELSTIWAFAQANNAKNVCEVKHGLPFLRLANFGFMAAPSASDLAGILNANSAYTFCTGVTQLAMGVYMMTTMEWPIPLEYFLPFVISSVSLVLSLCNVFLDFSQILTEIGIEQKILDDMESDSKSYLETEKIKLRQDRDEKVNKAKEDFEKTKKTKLDSEHLDSIVDAAEAAFDIELSKLLTLSCTRLETELRNHRQRMERIKAAKKGTTQRSKMDEVVLNKADEYAEVKKKWQGIIDARAGVFDKKAELLNVEDDEYTNKLLAINKDRDAEVAILKVERDKELRAVGGEATLLIADRV